MTMVKNELLVIILLLQLLVLIILFIPILQSFKQKTSAKNLVLTNAKKVSKVFHTAAFIQKSSKPFCEI